MYQLTKHLRELYEKKHFADLVINSSVDNASFNIHRVLLCAHSKEFETQYFSLNEKEVSVDLPADILGQFVELIYKSNNHFNNHDQKETLEDFCRIHGFSSILKYLYRDDRSLIEDTAAGLARFVNNEIFSDIQFKVIEPSGVKIVHAHRAILASRSEVFEALLCGPMAKESQEYIEITDCPYDSFLLFLQFLYSCKMKDTDPDEEKRAYKAIDLLRLSDQYFISDLKIATQQWLKKYIDKKNVFEFIKLSTMYNASKLLKHIVYFTAQNYHYMSNQPEWEEMTDEFKSLSLLEYKRITHFAYAQTPRAAWVEAYLDSPHSKPLRSGDSIDDEYIKELGYNPEKDRSKFDCRRKDNKKKETN
eukprot:TRINITY_DN3021_c0_g1_i1.p1 TRINITY_DN3021_c0_g1~~TRINITY_DN3021_c0_g1_i1.p1  ORF type:complete len:362 (-),score=72.48 TRINITY_DN3021_c0_g1_i1:163-1248(-)